MNVDTKLKPKVSIGMAVYNGERFIRSRLESILSQTFTDFELIISDDSIDETPIICEEYAKRDTRIHHIHNQKRIGWVRSYIFLVNEAKGEYFVWAPVDDTWSPNFLEENVKVLDSNEKIVGSISKVELYGSQDNEVELSPHDSYLKKIFKKVRRSFRPFGTHPLNGSFEEKVSRCLRSMSPASLYAVFRTDKLRKSIKHEPVGSWDFITLLSVLEFGDIHVLNEVLLRYYSGGISSNGMIYSYKHHQSRFVEVLFHFTYVTTWCRKHLGIKFIVKNLDLFLWLYFYHFVGLSLEIIRLIRQRSA